MMHSRAIASLPLVLLTTGCSYGFRAGPEVRSQPNGAVLEARGTAFVGVGSSGENAGQFGFPASLSVGSRLSGGGSEGTFDMGSEFTQVKDRLGFRTSMRVGTGIADTSGGYLNLRGGPLLLLAPIEEEELVPNLTLEAMVGVGTGGELQGAFLYGGALSFGWDMYPRPFSIPSGRPLRDDDGAPWKGEVKLGRKGAAVAGRALSRDEREQVGLSYVDDGLDELASIASFERLALELSAVGAPANLVRRARRAAREEARHARGCFALAEAHLGREVHAPSVPSLRPRHRWSIADIARESWFDGLLGEGVAAAMAKERAAKAIEPLARSVLTTIARDESGHARLAADVFGWCGRAAVS